MQPKAQDLPVRMVLFEEFTGSWCGWCPRGHLILEEICKDHPRVIPVAIHSGPGFDPMRTNHGDQLTEDMLIWYPTAAIDRFKFDNKPVVQLSDSEWAEMVLIRLQKDPVVDISLEKDYESGSGILNILVRVKFLTEAKGDFRFNAYLIEDGITGGSDYDQRNYYNENENYPDLYGRGDPISGYVFDHVLREMLGGPYGINPEGSGKIPESVNKNEQYSYSFSTILKNNYHPENIQLVGFMLRHDGPQESEVLNATSVSLLETGVTSHEIRNDLLVYPNPGRGIFQIRIQNEGQGTGKLFIRDLKGQILFSEDYRNVQYSQVVRANLDFLQPGVYLFEWTNQAQTKVRKVIITD